MLKHCDNLIQLIQESAGIDTAINLGKQYKRGIYNLVNPIRLFKGFQKIGDPVANSLHHFNKIDPTKGEVIANMTGAVTPAAALQIYTHQHASK